MSKQIIRTPLKLGMNKNPNFMTFEDLYNYCLEHKDFLKKLVVAEREKELGKTLEENGIVLAAICLKSFGDLLRDNSAVGAMEKILAMRPPPSWPDSKIGLPLWPETSKFGCHWADCPPA